tara:strand:- start:70 stop:219 length:150 start_codon:yes stop_codon:yes gene_type:complete
MLRDLFDAFGRIANHMGIVHAADLTAVLTTAATFQNMKANAGLLTVVKR